MANNVTTINLATSDVSTAPFEKPWGNYVLEKIVETQAPETISWLPQTLGWKIILTGSVAYLLLKSYRAYKTYQQNAYRREALNMLSQLPSPMSDYKYRQLPLLLRKTALTAFKRADVTQLHGEFWELWLDKQCKETNFSQQCPTLLHQLSFAPTLDEPEEQYQQLISQITLWIKFHRRQND